MLRRAGGVCLSLGVLLSGAACDLREPAEIPIAEVSVLVADTLSFGRHTASLALLAVDRDGNALDARQLTRRTATWSSSHPEVTVESTGSDSAVATWSIPPGSNLIYGLSTVTVTVTIDAIEASANIVVCPASQVSAHNSAVLIAGRSSALPVSVLAPSGSALSGLNVMLQSAGWSSSDVSVVSATGETATAHRVGEATLIASACGRSDTVHVQVVEQPYAVTFLGAHTRGLDLNNGNTVLGVTEAPAQNAVPWVWNGGSFTVIQGCTPLRLNDLGTVLCNGRGPVLWTGGSIVRDTMDGVEASMDDLDRVLMADPRRYPSYPLRWRRDGRIDSLRGSFRGSVDIMNDLGDVVGSGGELYRYPEVYYANGDYRRLGVSGRQGSASAMNDSGDVVGSGEGMSTSGRAATAKIWLRPAGETRGRESGSSTNTVASAATDINNRRVVVGNGSRGAFVWSNGRLGLLSELVAGPWAIEAAIAINDNGIILARGRNTSTGEQGAVLLTPPQ